jgi:hypothetical protein
MPDREGQQDFAHAVGAEVEAEQSVPVRTPP